MRLPSAIFGSRPEAQIEGREAINSISEAFENVVLGHVYNNLLFPETAPLLLVIIGESGSGKSFGVQEICRRYGISYKKADGSIFQGNEGASRRKLKEAFLDALKGIGVLLDELSPANATIAHMRTPAVLIIDDLHLSLASERSNNFSQNTQIFQSAMMSVCDDPASILELGPIGSKMRVPIIATTNATTEIYKPLLRHGRARLFDWKPNSADIERAARNLLSSLSPDVVDAIIKKYRREFPAFFRELASRAREKVIVNFICNQIALDPKEILTACASLELSDQVKHDETLRHIKTDQTT